MTAPYYTDDSVTLWHGDCLDVLRTLPDCSVDSVVTDPPYALEFMGKDWDRPWAVTPGASVGYEGRDDLRLPQHRDSRNANCRACGGRQRGAKRCECAKPKWDRSPAQDMRDFQAWCSLWTPELLRVLKPGGHLLAFGAPRTYHRMAVAIEDAGFEIRDSLMWLFGSGFPKSHDIGKAIDRAAGAEREVVGTRTDVATRIYDMGEGERLPPVIDITAPATAEAQAWDGWGTAMKPAHEPIILARKPLAVPGVNVLVRVELELRNRGVEGEIRWTSRPASGAAKPDHSRSSSTTQAQPTGATSAAPAAESGKQKSEPQTDRNTATTTPHGDRQTGSTCEHTAEEGPSSSGLKSSPPTVTPAPVAGKQQRSSSPSTTSTGEAPLTVEQPGARSTTRSSARGSLPATESFAGIATGLTGSWTTVLITRLPDGTYVWPDGLPRSVGGGTTVAANILTWGVGGLNVDGTRIGTDGGGTSCGNRDESGKCQGHDNAGRSTSGATVHGPDTASGRWPANVILDDTAAALLDQQSGESAPKAERTGRKGGCNDNGSLTGYGAADDIGTWPGDAGGGASRFFYTPKADRHERPRVDGIAHPTVKPVDLIAYLVRLITPRGGVVLDPFAGTGTTAEAATAEGCRTILIERETDYLPLIMQRLQRPVEVTLL